jgi:tripartite motif-containing protein 2/3
MNCKLDDGSNGVPLCSDCLVLHRKSKWTKGHALTDNLETFRAEVKRAKKAQENMCSEHGQLLIMFCNECEEIVCSGCVTTSHRGHEFVSVDEASRQKRDELERDMLPKARTLVALIDFS